MACRLISYFLLSSSVETVKLTTAFFLCLFLILWNASFCLLMNLIAFFMRSISLRKIQKTGWKRSLMQSTQRAVHLLWREVQGSIKCLSPCHEERQRWNGVNTTSLPEESRAHVLAETVIGFKDWKRLLALSHARVFYATLYTCLHANTLMPSCNDTIWTQWVFTPGTVFIQSSYYSRLKSKKTKNK